MLRTRPANVSVSSAEAGGVAMMKIRSEKIKKIWVGEVRERIKSVQEGKSVLLDFNQLYAED